MNFAKMWYCKVVAFFAQRKRLRGEVEQLLEMVDAQHRLLVSQFKKMDQGSVYFFKVPLDTPQDVIRRVKDVFDLTKVGLLYTPPTVIFSSVELEKLDKNKVLEILKKFEQDGDTI